MKIQLVSFAVQGLLFNEVVRIDGQGSDTLLTESVGQCRNILPLAFSALTFLQSVNMEKAAGNIFLR